MHDMCIYAQTQVHIPAEDADLSAWADPVVKIAATCETVSLTVFPETTEARWLIGAHGA
jgi:hypothetical protein